METLRCSTCIGVLTEPVAHRCPFCGRPLRGAHAVSVLGEDTRVGTAPLLVDEWMARRVRGESPPGTAVAPVVWEGRFTDVSDSGRELVALMSLAPAVTPVAVPMPGGDAPAARAVVTVSAPVLAAEPEPAAAPELPGEADASAEESTPPESALDPEVQGIIDRLYEQARAEVAPDDAPTE